MFGKREAAKEATSLADLQAFADGTEIPPQENSEPKSRKPRADKGQSRSKGRTSKTKVWLLEAEASYITLGLQMFIAYRYGVAAEAPEKEEQKHLVAALRKLEDFPPFAFIQRLLLRIIPMADPKAKPGGSILGGLVHYGFAWHSKNDGLALHIYTADPVIPELPLLPKRTAQSAQKEEATTEAVKVLTPEEFLQKEAEMKAEAERMAS